MAEPKLIVVLAFDRAENGNLLSAFEPREMPSELAATTVARLMAGRHDGVIAWSRSADPDIGENGPPTVLFQVGYVPEIE